MVLQCRTKLQISEQSSLHIQQVKGRNHCQKWLFLDVHHHVIFGSWDSWQQRTTFRLALLYGWCIKWLLEDVVLLNCRRLACLHGELRGEAPCAVPGGCTEQHGTNMMQTGWVSGWAPSAPHWTPCLFSPIGDHELLKLQLQEQPAEPQRTRAVSYGSYRGEQLHNLCKTSPLKRYLHPHSYVTLSAAEPNPDCAFYAPWDPCSLQMVSHGLG